MFKKVKPYLAYVLAGSLGLLTFILSAFSGIVSTMVVYGSKWKSTESVYSFMDFTTGEPAWNAAGVFEIFLIIVSVALISLSVLGILSKMGKIKFSLGKLSIEDLLMYITFGFVVFALIQTICAGAFVGQNSALFSSSFYMTVGAGPLLLLFMSAALAVYQVLTKWFLNGKFKKITKSVKKEKEIVESEVVEDPEVVISDPEEYKE